MNEPLQAGLGRPVEQEAEGIDVELAKVVELAPVAHAGRAVDHPMRAGDAPPQRGFVGQVADDLHHAPTVE